MGNPNQPSAQPESSARVASQAEFPLQRIEARLESGNAENRRDSRISGANIESAFQRSVDKLRAEIQKQDPGSNVDTNPEFQTRMENLCGMRERCFVKFAELDSGQKLDSDKVLAKTRKFITSNSLSKKE